MKVLNSFHLKIIAIVTMTIDHIGLILYPSTDFYRIVGRICFPLIAFLIAEGYKHTSSVTKYITRLVIFAVTIQFVMYFLESYRLNIFFTLALGLSLISLIEKERYISCVPLLLIPYLLPIEYGYYGVIMIVMMYFAKNLAAASIIFMNIVFIDVLPMTQYYEFSMPVIQFYSVLAIPFILLYNGLEGKKMKYWFYFYYPIHLVILLIIKEFLYA